MIIKDFKLYIVAFWRSFLTILMGNVQAAMYAVSQGAVVRMVSHDTDSYLFSHGDYYLRTADGLLLVGTRFI